MFRVLDIYNFACTLGFARGIYTDEYGGRDRDAVSASYVETNHGYKKRSFFSLGIQFLF